MTLIKKMNIATALALLSFSVTPLYAEEAPAPVAADVEAEFKRCVPRLQQRARAEKIADDVVEKQLGAVQYVARVIELDRRQPEFSETFYNYLTLRVNDQRITQGRELLKKHYDLLLKLTHQYGVPPQYIVSFWGLETNFGTYLGKMNVLDSLATLACDPRRSEFFTKELMEALRLVETGVADHDTMLGSWAGAMGNMQFMPSAYRRFAVDGDGDGKADLWNSLPDAFTSAANFLQHLGWEKEVRWGREIRLPEKFDYALAGRDVTKPLKEWSRMGITDVTGNALPELDLKSSVIIPAGHNGPSFMVYDNFHVIMDWNRSEFYAIAVGRLADRINGAGALKVPPPQTERMNRDDVRWIQEALNSLGYDTGEPDGIFGSRTKRALRDFQKSKNMVADGFPSEEVIARLKAGITS
ncbi:lytic murein transglycosylase [Ketobacter sp.]